MKKIYPQSSSNNLLSGFTLALLVIGFLLCGSIKAQPAVFFSESFESTSGYSFPKGNGGSGEDFFDRTDITHAPAQNNYTYSGYDGSYFIAAEDIDGILGTSLGQVLIEDIDIAGYTDLDFKAQFASGTSQGIDALGDAIWVEVSIDNGNWVEIGRFEADISSGTNSQFKEDTDGDGVGEGTALNGTFADYSWNISGTGTLLDVRISVDLNSGAEEAAFDNIRIIGISSTTEPEPSDHVSSFSVSANAFDKATASWNDATGTQTPSAYLIKFNESNSFTDPVDGTDSPEDHDLSDGDGLVKVSYGVEGYSFTHLYGGTTYYFKIWPYTNSGSNIDYKTDGTVPTSNTTTNPTPAQISPSYGDLIITEVCGDGAQNGGSNGFVEIYNQSSTTVNLTDVSVRYYNSNPGSSTAQVALSGTIASDNYIVITQDNTAFNNEYGFDADYANSGFYFNGDDDGIDIYYSGTKAGVIDEFNETGISTNPWTWDDLYTYERVSNFEDGTTNANWNEIYSSGSPLPVSLLSFEARQNPEHILISWATATEENNDYFTLERSANMENWQVVTMVKGAGNSNQVREYKVKDHDLSDKTIYFRLKQTDFDGIFSYSEVIAVDPGKVPSKLQAQVIGTNDLLVSGINGDKLSLQVYNMEGRLLLIKEMSKAGEAHLISLEHYLLPRGLYIVRLIDATEVVSIKLQK